jgi:hypothetical protein
VRKRIKNGSLAAERSGGQWNVLLPPESLSSSGAAEITPPKPHGYVTPEAVEQAIARAGGTFSGDLRAVSEERRSDAQLAAETPHLDGSSRRMVSVERRRAPWQLV